MTTLVPAESTRDQILKVVGLSFLLPGLGHVVAGWKRTGLIWMVVCQGMMFLGLQLAGFTQFDYGFRWGESLPFEVVVLLPESFNFGGVLLFAQFFDSVDNGGVNVEALPYRQLGYLLSGMAGILGILSAPHAAGMTLTHSEPLPLSAKKPKCHPGVAAIAAMLFPGLGHFLIGRKFKAYLLGGTVLGMFVLGMAMGHYADFDRQRHAYYWIGQMLMGLPAWLVYLPLMPLNMGGVFPYQDTGFTFTSVAGMFNVVVALDAYHRAEYDWLAAKPKQEVESE
ncbi:MAG: hypothetical protein HQ519_17695 [Planctomycetes bacterium]|nr:hypothetical protein [Planctomycetota bacterium]